MNFLDAPTARIPIFFTSFTPPIRTSKGLVYGTFPVLVIVSTCPSKSNTMLTTSSNKNVFVVGLEEGLLPHRSSIDEDNIEEERRLFYVAITRAQRGLTLSIARERQRYGETLECEPSRFLEELPRDDLDWQVLGRKVSTEEKMSQGNAALDQIRAILG